MSSNGHATASKVRAQLHHPVIDADGHWLEFGPLVREELRRIGGAKAVEGFATFPKLVEKDLTMSLAERRRKRVGQQAFWALPTKNTRDRATSVMPKLLYERLGELGIDFTVLYPTIGLGLPLVPDEEQRRAVCRAFNTFSAEYFKDFADRMTPAAVIPMHTPQEAIEELDYAVNQLGLKVVMLGSLIKRPIPDVVERYPEAASVTGWRDVLGLDSDYDYDPVWAKCVELKVAPSFHSGGRGYAMRISPSNFTYNHIGHFAAANEAVCKALFLGGVTRRFPQLKFAFLEGGVGWACQLYVDLIGHWQKRNIKALEEVNPDNLDFTLFQELAKTYGNATVVAALRNKEVLLDTAMSPIGNTATGGIENLDDYAACKISKAEDIKDLYVKNFYFGCEADDRMNVLAFNRQANPFGAQINALFGSDIGHFDVADMAHVLPEAYELVEDGLMTAENFRDFVCTNPLRFFGETNPDFFKGTVVEGAAASVLAKGNAPLGVNRQAASQVAR
ncbi:MAG: amidohydrolase family protein [Candidatus Binatia bacterium]